jgi:DNA-binding transcriptional LysR family regulator
MRLNERHLIQLAAVLDSGGVTEAAAMLGLSQPAVSRSLSMLEARVGQPLFLRGRRPLQATPLGQQLAAHGRAMLAAARKASDAVESFRSGSSGLVRVGGVPFFMDAVISRMIAAFQNLEPDVTVQQSYGHLPEMQAALAADELDLAVVPMGLVEAAPGFLFAAILPARNILACRRAHPLLRKPRLQGSDLLDYPWVAPLPGSPLLSDLQMIRTTIGLPEVNIRFAGGSLMSVVNYMTETDALTVLPHSVVFALRREAGITVLPLEIPQPARALGLLRRRLPEPPQAVARFAAHVAGGFDEMRALILRHERTVAAPPLGPAATRT